MPCSHLSWNVTRRVLVASLPLYQPVEPATQLGYEVHVYAHVLYTSNGPDRVLSWCHRHSRGHSGSGSGSGSSSSVNAAKEYTRWLSSSIMLATDLSKPAMSSGSATPASVNHPCVVQAPLVHGSGCMCYHEQDVDKLLQLKLLQVVSTVDVPLPGSMIVLVTGDGNVSQFNKEGFCGCMHTALKKGWRVKLYMWESGLSQVWVREFTEGSWASHF